MAPSSSAQQPASKRGSLSARQWQDLRQAARLACSEKVTLVVHGVKISPDHQHAGNSRADRDGAHDTGQVQQRQQQRQQPQQPPPQSVDTAGAPATEVSDSMEIEHVTKRQQREARRRAEHVPRRCVNRWLTFTQKALWTARRQHLDAVFTAHMRTRLRPERNAQHKLHDLLTRACTRRFHRRAVALHRLALAFWRVRTFRYHQPPEAWAQSLAPWSARDNYIHQRAQTVSLQLQKLGIIATIPPASAAMDASTSDARHSGGRKASTRKVEDAGIPVTPGSARSRKKRSGRR